MSTFLLTWNPKRWHWEDLEEVAEATAGGKPYERRWSCGNRKTIEEGDRVFLIRLGEEPRGIIGAGTVTGPVVEDDHWDDTEGRKALFITASFDRILDPSLDDPLDVLGITTGPLSGVRWSTQSSGILIPDDAAVLLEDLWAGHIGDVDWANAEIMVDPDAETFPEGKVLFRLHRMRERNEEVIERAKARANDRDGKLSCCVCRFDFVAVYGPLGEGFIEGHHTTPLADLDGETETKVSDIALVCSNCHRMLHRRRPWLGIDQLQAILVQNQ